MASLYTRANTRYFWIKYRTKAGVRQVSTKFRTDIPSEVRKAKTLEAQYTLLERQEAGVIQTSRGWAWVDDYLDARYAATPITLERYRNCWQSLKVFLEKTEVLSPAHLTRKHCFDYVPWRQKPHHTLGVYAAQRNTALLDLKILGMIMHEAVERELVAANPCVKLQLKRNKPREKPELTASDCQTIRAAIQNEADPVVRTMLHNSFEIARHQGCRLSETKLDPQADVDLAAGTIRFRAKGGKQFVTMLHPQLRPLFEQLRREGARTTWHTPDGRGRQWASAKWWKFLDQLGLKARGITFHSTRVTVVTELARSNVHESKAKGFVGHSSTVVHQIYQRLRPADLSDCVAAVASEHPSSSNPGSPSGT